MHDWVEHPIAGRLFLGPVHGYVCVPKENFRDLHLGSAHGYADAGRDEHLLSIEYEWLFEPFLDALDDPYYVFGVHYVFEQNGELVTAKAGEGILGAQAVPQAFAHRHEQP